MAARKVSAAMFRRPFRREEGERALGGMTAGVSAAVPSGDSCAPLL